MLKKFLIILLLTLIFLFSTPKSFAIGEFSTFTSINYDISQDGITTVTENISIENLTDRYYPSSFSLSIGSTDIYDVSANDFNGPLNVKVTNENNKSKIDVEFNEQMAGLGKQYKWTLKFRSKSFAEKQGKVWQVSIPKISTSSESENYNLTLSVPDNFGDPSYILPKPEKQSESTGKQNYYYSKEIIKDSGIIVNFGTKQIYDFKLVYKLTNNSFLPTIFDIAIPPDTEYQQIIINSILPKPQNIKVDKDGNFIAQILVGRKKSLDVLVEGIAKLSTEPLSADKSILETDKIRLVTTQKYWESDNPIIKQKLGEILGNSRDLTNEQKAKLIHKFVAKTLKYDEDRIKNEDFVRFGGITALNNINKSLCSEYSDLFITLARAANIPARGLTGYAYTSNQELRPLSYQKNILHAWPEYYDSKLGWVMIDPTWENTTGGMDYFSKIDLNHFVFYKESETEKYIKIPDEINVNFSEKEFYGESNAQTEFIIAKNIFAGFPAKTKIRIENRGTQSFPSTSFSLMSNKVDIEGNKNFVIPKIPPLGYLEYEFDLHTASLWESYEDNLQLKIGNKQIDQKVLVKPFVAFNYFFPAVVILVLLMIFIYGAVLYYNLKHPKIVKKIYKPEENDTKSL